MLEKKTSNFAMHIIKYDHHIRNLDIDIYQKKKRNRIGLKHINE